MMFKIRYIQEICLEETKTFVISENFKMNIQCVSNKKLNYTNIKCSSLENPEAFDSFDINIIDLSDAYVWRSDSKFPETVNLVDDFNNIKTIINKSKCQNIIFLLPQDLDVYHDYSYNFSRDKYEYHESTKLKNLHNNYFLNNLRKIGVDFIRAVYFENNHYYMNQKQYDSSFFFDDCPGVIVLQKAINSDKTITLRKDRIICTFLELETEESIFDFLNDLKLLNRIDIPDWLNKYNFLNDLELKQDIDNQTKIIEKANEEIKHDNEQISKNIYYKSILIQNDSELVKRVFNILDEILGINLTNDFIDEKREDFIIKEPNITFIGEIKGVTSNVKNEHISQVDNHRSLYEDKLQEENREENLKKVLIINHQRNTDISSREKIHVNQVKKAKKEDVLIIETITLLKIYEAFKNNTITKDTFLEMLTNETGVLSF